MNQDFVKIKRVASAFQRAKPGHKFDRLAFVDVGYHDIEICGSLVRGKTEEGKWFYFFMMPHLMYKMGERLKKINMVNWPQKELSDEFQKVVIDQLIALNPQFFHPDYKVCKKEKVNA